MTCTGADGRDCLNYGVVVPCGPEPPFSDTVPVVNWDGPVIMTVDGATVMWKGEDVSRNPADTIQFLVQAKAYHNIYDYQEEQDVAVDDTGTAVLAFSVEIAVLYKVSMRRYRNGMVGPWSSQYIFYGGTDYTYLVDAAGNYLVQDDDDTVYLVSENLPDSSTWALDPDGNLMLDPDGNPVQNPGGE